MKCSKNKKAITFSKRSKSCGSLFDVGNRFGGGGGGGGDDTAECWIPVSCTFLETIGTRNGRSVVSLSPSVLSGVVRSEILPFSECSDFSSSGNRCNNVRKRWSRRFDNIWDCTRSVDI